MMKRKKAGFMVAMIILAVLLVMICAFGFYLAGITMTGKRQTLEEARKWQEDHYDLSWYDVLEKNDYLVKSFDEYELHAKFLKNPEPTERYVIISHGYTDNHIGSLKYARMYLDLGFNMIIYDLRGHGENQPDFCTYSAREREDLWAIIQDSRTRYPGAETLGIHGESLGAATSIAVLEKKPYIDFVVADCGFSEIKPVLKYVTKQMHVPGLMTDIASLCAKIRYGYSYGQMRPNESLKENQIPILFIHGAEDDFIFPEHSEKMKAETEGYAELHLIPGAGHALSVLTAPGEYMEIVRTFLERIADNTQPNSLM